MPIAESFQARIVSQLPQLLANYGTPFHIYDAKGIAKTHCSMVKAFGAHPFKQYFAVKALPNPHILKMLVDLGSGLDCSSMVELEIAKRLGLGRGDTVYTSNNTPWEEFSLADEMGGIITFDDISYLDAPISLPDVIAFRISPNGMGRKGLMGDSQATKFGVAREDLAIAYKKAKTLGAERFGIHGMMCANELDLAHLILAAENIISVAAQVAREADVEFEYINLGGGIGIPYFEQDKAIDFGLYADNILSALQSQFPMRPPKILMECGRYVSGPHGVLITKVINHCKKGREIIGVDASMSSLMRPAMYGAYHHITFPMASSSAAQESEVDVVGSLCENMDKFARTRRLPAVDVGDIALIHDTGAHGHAMGFTYNGRLRPAELMMMPNDEVICIRRAETLQDYLATVSPGVLKPM